MTSMRGGVRIDGDIIRIQQTEFEMHTLLWVLQALAALLYGASGVMKVFMFEQISADVPAFGALPRPAWLALGCLELVCVLGLILPGLLHWRPALTGYAAGLLALESLILIWVHVQVKEPGPMIMMATLGLVMAFVAYGRLLLRPIV